jgi:hypothetical protein
MTALAGGERTMATLTSSHETPACSIERCTIQVFHPTLERQLERRIRGEYKEMPGLRLSPQQAARLWSIDCDTCTNMLDALVNSGFLRRDRNGMYARSHRGC